MKRRNASNSRDNGLAAIEAVRSGDQWALGQLADGLRHVSLALERARDYPPAAALTPEPPRRQHWTDDLADLDDEDLACLGMRRVSDSDPFPELRGENLLEAVRKADCFKPRADPTPAKPRRQRKPSFSRLATMAKELGVVVTREPNGAVTVRADSTPVDVSDPEIELKKWKARHAR